MKCLDCKPGHMEFQKIYDPSAKRVREALIKYTNYYVSQIYQKHKIDKFEFKNPKMEKFLI